MAHTLIKLMNKVFVEISCLGKYKSNLLITGRKLKLRHFRENVELPWIANDPDYDFNFQQSRPLRNHVLVLPGDQLSFGKASHISSGQNISDRFSQKAI